MENLDLTVLPAQIREARERLRDHVRQHREGLSSRQQQEGHRLATGLQQVECDEAREDERHEPQHALGANVAGCFDRHSSQTAHKGRADALTLGDRPALNKRACTQPDQL